MTMKRLYESMLSFVKGIDTGKEKETSTKRKRDGDGDGDERRSAGRPTARCDQDGISIITIMI